MEQLSLFMSQQTTCNQEIFDLASFSPHEGVRPLLHCVLGWPQSWPGKITTFVGPPKSGKTHLAKIWQDVSNAVSLDLSSTSDWFVPESAPIVIDGLEKLHNEEGRFQNDVARLMIDRLNELRAKNCWVLICTRVEPSKVFPPDLGSRMIAGNTIEIELPDESAMLAISLKILKDNGIIARKSGTAIIIKAIRYLERSYESLVKFANTVVSLAHLYRGDVCNRRFREKLAIEMSIDRLVDDENV